MSVDSRVGRGAVGSGAADARSVGETTPAAAAHSASRRLLPVLFVGVFMAALDTAVISPAIPALRAAFAVDNREIGLVITVFILCSLCSTALMANLSDRYGRRPIYLASVSCFALGSLLIAVSPKFWMLIASRALQGAGAGGITPTASAVVGDSFPPAERGKALGLIGATYGMAFVLGPPLASLLLVASNWRWIFLLNLPIAALVIVLGARVLPRLRAGGTQPPLDRAGIALTFLLLATLVLGITRIADELSGLRLWPWLLTAAATCLALLVPVERRAAQALLPLQLFANRQLAITYGLSLGAGFGMGAIIFVTSIATAAYAVPPQRVGFVLMPLVLASIFGSMGAGRLLNRIGARTLLASGFALLTAGYAGLSATGFGIAGFFLATLPVGLGIGIVVGGALRAIALDEAPLPLRGAGQGLVNICNAIGTLLSAAAIGAIADFVGRGIAGFIVAYRVIAACMLLTCLVTLALRRRAAPLRSEH